ncbi:MAG TPA: hypothetical protein DEP91_06870 [Sphingomonas bacterium]|uniref:Uncharacterized protein n=1 Tax=Sphingomonas bacterium TaxID=1895847 RepID=A0A3D0WDN2_9SPHN|nr:hypothetical protein [Sphingomonas bacterium]
MSIPIWRTSPSSIRATCPPARWGRNAVRARRRTRRSASTTIPSSRYRATGRTCTRPNGRTISARITASRSAALTPRVNYAYVGPQFTYLGYSPLSDRIDGRGLLSALVTLDMGDRQVTAYGTNLTNKDYVSGQFNSNEFYGAPREYRVRVRVAF